MRRNISHAGNFNACVVKTADAAVVGHQTITLRLGIVLRALFPASAAEHDAAKRMRRHRRLGEPDMPFAKFLRRQPLLLIYNSRDAVFHQIFRQLSTVDDASVRERVPDKGLLK